MVICIQLQLQDEWNPDLGKKNIGISAVVETDKCNPTWVTAWNKKRKLPYWIYYKPFNEINEDRLILLNYSKNSKFNFEKYVVLDNHQNKCFYLRKK